MDEDKIAIAESLAAIFVMARNTATKVDIALLERGLESQFETRFGVEAIKEGFTQCLYASMKSIPFGRMPHTSNDACAMSPTRQQNREALNTFVKLRNVMGLSNETALLSIQASIMSAVSDQDADFFAELGALIKSKRKMQTGCERSGHAGFIRRLILPLQLYNVEDSSGVHDEIVNAADLLHHPLPKSRRELMKAINREMAVFRRALANSQDFTSDAIDWPKLVEMLAARHSL